MNPEKLFKDVLKQEAQAITDCALKITPESLGQIVDLFGYLEETGSSLIISGVGKSGLIGKKIASTFSSLGLPAFYLHPTEAMHGDLGRVSKSDALMMLTKSGTTQELIDLLPYMRIPKERIICLVGNTHSPLAHLSGIVLDCSVVKEACLNDLAPTTSTTVTLAIGDALAVLYVSTMSVSKEKFALNHPAGLLGKSLALKVEKLMIPAADCAFVTSQDTLRDAILEMTNKPLGMCIVLQDNKFEGILVEGDIRRAFAQNEDALNLKVDKIMTKNPIAIESDLLAYEAFKLMENRSNPISVLPVFAAKKWIGLLRLHDLFKAGFSSTK